MTMEANLNLTPEQTKAEWMRIFVAARDKALALGRMTLQPDTPVDPAPFGFQIGCQPIIGSVQLVGQYDPGDDSVEVFVDFFGGDASATLTRGADGAILNLHLRSDRPSWFNDLGVDIQDVELTPEPA
jgi:hypothetical protein